MMKYEINDTRGAKVQLELEVLPFSCQGLLTALSAELTV